LLKKEEEKEEKVTYAIYSVLHLNIENKYKTLGPSYNGQNLLNTNGFCDDLMILKLRKSLSR